jgi:type IV pilus assembly protein PilA
MLNNIKSLQKQRGFTIVELLIVIIVIAILATITIIAYNGITTRANATRAKGNAANVLKVVEAYAADDANPTAGAYPTPAQLTGWTGGVAKMPQGVTINSTLALTASSAGDGKTITYMNKGTTGGCIGYWDATPSVNAMAWLYAGNGATGGNAAPPTCV